MNKPIARCRQLGAQWHGRLAHHQRCEQRRQHHHAEQYVSAGPGFVQVAETCGAEPFGKEQGASGGEQRSDSVTGHVACGQRGLALIVGNLQAIGIDSDVLGGRRERDQHGQSDQPRQMLLRVTQAHAHQADHHQRL
ncbi:hypothetical protein D3C81_1297970 [compost metagenome]